ncbi:MAG: hypothetical protein IK999_10645 [Ruminococcus sp.]|nr:hypothetical protein [Ruminococcus sp.]
MNDLMLLADNATTYLPTAITGVDFTQVLNEITAIAPSLLPVAVACLAFRKGISFMFSILRGA